MTTQKLLATVALVLVVVSLVVPTGIPWMAVAVLLLCLAWLV